MSTINNLKELAVLEYLSNVDFKGKNWSVARIKADLKAQLGEEPAISIDWVKHRRLNEIKGEIEVQEVVESVTIAFTTDSMHGGVPEASHVKIMV